MRRSPCLLVLATFALVGCAEEPTTVTTTTTREVTTTGPATRQVLVTQAPPAVRVETQPVLARTSVCLEKRLLALDRSPVCVGPRHVDRASNAGGCLGRRPLGAEGRRLGVDCGPLAVNTSSDDKRAPRNTKAACIVSRL
jgi:hypothetical protein